MKRLLPFVFFLISIAINAQIVNIPDANFKDILVNQNRACLEPRYVYGELYFPDSIVDTNGDGEIQVSEAENVYGLVIFGGEIESLTGLEHFTNLEYLKFTDNQLAEIDLTNNLNLKYLSIPRNSLNNLDLSNNSLIDFLEINSNNLSLVDLSPMINLKYLDCSSNLLDNVNFNSNIDLEFINCSSNPLQVLNLSNNVYLEKLLCSNTDLSELDLSNNLLLLELSCVGNSITSLNLNDNINLENLNCRDNLLTLLQIDNCSNLISLNASTNQLNNINMINNVNLEIILLGDNQLTNIDLSNNVNTTNLMVGLNQLTSLDISNLTHLESLSTTGNPLVTLNLKNGSLMNTNQYNSGNGFNVNSLNYICVDHDEIEQIEALVNPDVTVVNSYCSFFPGGTTYTINGESRLDLNFDGCDTNDSFFPLLKLNLTDGSNFGSYYPNSTGLYNLVLLEGTHSISPILENPSYFMNEPANFEVSFPEEGETFTQDICATPNGVYNDLEIVLSPIRDAVPGFNTAYLMVYRNIGNTILSGSVNLNYNDDYMDFVSSNTDTSSQNIGILTWDFTNLVPFETRTIQLTMNLNSPTDSQFPLNSGHELGFTAEILPIVGDENPNDNNFQLKQIVVNSYDPNDKTCLQGNELDIEKVGDYLHYMIRFENTGTANATNIVVKDALDVSRYDVSSLIPLNASHDFVSKVSNGNLVEFIFENINLPFDDANNDGFIVYKVKTLPDLEIWDVIENDAEIYFDFNFPIITNNEQTTVVEEGLSINENVRDNGIKIFPNPASNLLNIKTLNKIETVKVFDMTGHLLKTVEVTINNSAATVNINKLSTGFYFLEVQSGSIKSIHKVVKN